MQQFTRVSSLYEAYSSHKRSARFVREYEYSRLILCPRNSLTRRASSFIVLAEAGIQISS